MEKFVIKTILVPTDFSETASKALDYAIALAKKVKGKLVLVHVLEINGYTATMEMMSMGMVSEKMIASVKESLKEICSRMIEEHGIDAEFVCYSGNVFDNIIRAASLFDANLIVMGTHGTSGISEWLFGSNAFSVVNNTTIPVITVNLNSPNRKFKKIVFPFNGNLLTLNKLEQVIYLAKIFNSTILLFGYTENRLSSNMMLLRKKADELEEIFEKNKIRSSFSFAMGEGYAKQIIDFANHENADLISVITNRSHNMDKILKEKPDRQLVNHAAIPVFSVPVE